MICATRSSSVSSAARKRFAERTMPRKSSAPMRASMPRSSRRSMPARIASWTKRRIASRRCEAAPRGGSELLVALREREQEPPVPEEAQDLARDPLEAPGRRRARAASASSRAVGEPVEDVERRREVEVVLGLEVAVDRPLADPGVGGDVVDQDLVERAVREDVRRGLQDRALFGFGFDSRHRCSTYSGTDRSVLVSHTEQAGVKLSGTRQKSLDTPETWIVLLNVVKSRRHVLGTTERRERERQELRDADPRRRPRALRRGGLRGGHDAQDRRADRVLADGHLLPLPGQAGAAAGALRRRLRRARARVPEDRRRSRTRSSGCGRSAAPTSTSRSRTPTTTG